MEDVRTNATKTWKKRKRMEKDLLVHVILDVDLNLMERPALTVSTLFFISRSGLLTFDGFSCLSVAWPFKGGLDQLELKIQFKLKKEFTAQN